VWCGTRNGNVLIFQDSDTMATIKVRILSEIIYPFYTVQHCSTIKAHDDTVHSMVATEDGLVVTGSGSMDGTVALWLSSPQAYKIL